MLKRLLTMKPIGFQHLQYEDMACIEKNLSSCYVQQYENDNGNSCFKYLNRLWKYILKDLRLNDIDITKIINEYKPEMFWLKHAKLNILQMKACAEKVGREDIAVALQQWMKAEVYLSKANVSSISEEHIQYLAARLAIRPGMWRDWQIFADYSGCSGEEINQIHSLARDEMKVLVYMYDQHGDVDINYITSVARKYNVIGPRLAELDQTIGKIECNIINRI